MLFGRNSQQQPAAPAGGGQATQGYGAQPTGSYGAQAPGNFGAAPQGSYGAQGNYGAVPQGSYGAVPQGNYGAAPQGSYGTAPQGNYGAASQGQSAFNQAGPWSGATGYPSQPAGTGYAGYTPGTAQQAPASYTETGGYRMPGQQAYGQGGNTWAGYPQAGQQGYTAPQGGAYPPQNAAGSGYGYPPQNATGQNYAYPPQGQNGPGYSYPAQTQGYSYSPQGQGYGPGGAQGYSYAPMGRNRQPAQEMGQQIPLNGGGYVPPAVPVRKQPFQFKPWMLIALGAALALLLGVGLFLKMPALQWAFIVLAASSIGVFWVRPLVPANHRLSYTIIFGVLILVALLSALGFLQPRQDTTRNPAQPAAATAQPGGSGSGAVIDPETGNVISSVAQAAATPTPTPVADDTSTTDRLETFFRYWSANRQDEMLTLCAPSWQSSVDNPKTALFGLLANRTPLDYTVEKVSGTVDDTSRTVTVTSTMDRNNGKEPVKYRLGVLMVREGDTWYVDPQSLKTYEKEETPDPSITEAPTPTAEPLVNSATVLYYNPDGGTKYHLDQNCKSTHAKYLPMKGHFTYGEINDEKYASLSPCNVCAAPLRP